MSYYRIILIPNETNAFVKFSYNFIFPDSLTSVTEISENEIFSSKKSKL